MNLFPIAETENWHLQPDNYPSLYLVDVVWYKCGTNSAPAFELFSYTEPVIPVDQQANIAHNDPPEFHSEKTLAVIRNIVPNFPVGKMTLISAKRRNQLGDSLQHKLNIPEAIESIRFVYPPPPVGSVIMVNLSLNDCNSVITDKHIGQQLVKLTESGYVVIVAAGNNTNQSEPGYVLFPIESTPSGNHVVVVGGYSDYSSSRNHIQNYVLPESNYGAGVTCYMPVPISLNLYNVDVDYGQSSAATAQIAGVVLLMQNYACSRSRFLTSAEVQDILSTNGNRIVIHGNGQTINSFTPTWSALTESIDAKLNWSLRRPPRTPQGGE